MPKFAYCVYCYAGEDVRVSEKVQAMVSCETLIPLSAQRMYVKGQDIKQLHRLLPQYLYIYSDEPIGKLLHDRHISGVARWLGTEENDYHLLGTEYQMAMFFYGCGGLIDYQTAYQDGEQLVLLPYGKEYPATAEIIRVDRRKKRMRIRFAFGDTSIELWTGYEVSSD